MDTNIEKDIKEFKNKLWERVPGKVKLVIIVLSIIVSILYFIKILFTVNIAKKEHNGIGTDVSSYNQTGGITAENVDVKQSFYLVAEGDYSSPTPAKIRQEGSNVVKWRDYLGGMRKSYDLLLSWKSQIADSETKSILNDVLKEIENIYGNPAITFSIERFGYICKFADPPCSKGYEPITGFDSIAVFDHLTENKLWQERARAACLLRNIKTSPNKKEMDKHKLKLFNTLINHMKKESESHLVVSKMALDTYSELTRFIPSGTFDFEGAIKDWENPKRKEVDISGLRKVLEESLEEEKPASADKSADAASS